MFSALLSPEARVGKVLAKMRSRDDLKRTSTADAEEKQKGVKNVSPKIQEDHKPTSSVDAEETQKGDKHESPKAQAGGKGWDRLRPIMMLQKRRLEDHIIDSDHLNDTDASQSSSDSKPGRPDSIEGSFAFGPNDEEGFQEDGIAPTWRELFISKSGPMRRPNSRLVLKELSVPDMNQRFNSERNTRRRSSASTVFSSSGGTGKRRRASTATLRSVEGTCGWVTGPNDVNSHMTWFDDNRSLSKAGTEGTEGMSKLYSAWSHSTGSSAGA
jgi:hypothetical protein